MLGRIVTHVTAGSADTELQLRAHTLLWYSGIMMLLGVGWGLGHIAYGNVRVPIAAFGAVVVIAAAWVKLWRDRDLRFASHIIFACTFTVCVLGAYWTGGLRLTNISPFFLLMVAAVLLLGRPGLVWSALTLAIALAFQAAHELDYQFPDLVPAADREVDAAFSWISAAVMVFLFAVAFDRARRSAAERLQLANRAKSAFLANVSHELRNPVHNVETLHDRLASTDLTDEQRDLLASAREEVGGLYQFLSDLLDLAAAERGTFTLEHHSFSLAQTMNAARRVTETLCRAKGLQFETNAAALPERVWGDSRRIRQILTNLCGNAIKFTAAGKVSLTAEVTAQQDERLSCRFQVRDTGIGIPAADQKRVFETFVQMKGPWASEGSGLGLSITRELVEAMDGQLRLESTPGEGTTVTVDLPLTTAHPSTDSEPRRLRVLVADDEPLNRRFLERVLASLGHGALLAGDASEAVATFRSHQPDVVLMDLRMPGGGGLHATREIRAHGGATIIIGLTGQATPEARAECLAAGMDDCLFKPFTAETLEQVLRKLI